MASTTLIVAVILLITVASAADPTCSTGLPVADVCCPAGCEKCGGPDCSARSREKKLFCCLGAIRKMAANCLTSGPPCKRTTKDPDFMAGSDIPDPTCERGLRKYRACCPPECSTCGGAGCRKRSAYIKSLCCPSEIKKGPRGCKDTGAPCLMFKKSQPVETEMPMPKETPMEKEPEPGPVESPEMEEENPEMEKEDPEMEKEDPEMEEEDPEMEEEDPEMEEEDPEMEEEDPEMEKGDPEMEKGDKDKDKESPEMEKEKEKPLPEVCTSMRTKFLSGCFCYLIFSNGLKVKRGRLFRAYCKKFFGTRKKILSLIFTCRKFSGPKGPEKVILLVKRLNFIIRRCNSGLPRIREKL